MTPGEIEAYKGWSMFVWGVGILWFLYLNRRGRK